MRAIIDAAMHYSRTVILILLMIIMLGVHSYNAIPKEREPDIQIPFIYVLLLHPGISPEDAERLLIKPTEEALKNVEGIKRMTAQAVEGQASVTMEFYAGFDSDRALQDVREEINSVRAKLPDDTEEPEIHEVNLSLFPVLNVILKGDIPERTLITIARNLRDKIEQIPNVLSVDIAGDREDIAEVIVNPEIIENYNLSIENVINIFNRNNLLIAAGSLNNDTGRFKIEMTGVLEGIKDIAKLPIKVEGNSVVTASDLAHGRRSFRDATSYARADGESAVVLEISKKTGTNIIATTQQVRELIDEIRPYLPENLHISYAQDKSERILEMISDLQNNIILAILLVVIVVIAAIGFRSAILIMVSIPASFLFGIMMLYLMGFTINIVVLFSLILSIGMLVDSTIVICEYADRQIREGKSFSVAYVEAVKRMAWPLIASTLTTVIVFLPLLFWPGITGQFMKFMPITMMLILSGSLVMALIFIPVLGSVIGKYLQGLDKENDAEHEVEIKDSKYAKLLEIVLRSPEKFTAAIASFLVFIYITYGILGVGVEFFPKIEPENIQVLMHARGNLSVKEQDTLLQEVEHEVMSIGDEIKVAYARSGGAAGKNQEEQAEDVVGSIQVELSDWTQRRSSDEIIEEIRQKVSKIAGVIIEIQTERKGPQSGKPIQIEISSDFPDLIDPVANEVKEIMQSIDGLIDVDDNRSIPKIGWNIEVDREKAAIVGADIATIGNSLKFVTNGLLAGKYQPDDTDDEVDILIRFPEDKRNLTELRKLRVSSESGTTPIADLIKLAPKPTIGTIRRTDMRRYIKVSADIESGAIADNLLQELQVKMKAVDIDSRVFVKFAGDKADQNEASQFLMTAFILSLVAILIILVTQFNSFYQSFIIMSAIIFSSCGVLLGLLITNQPFGIVMCGIGIIALAGIVVNNNIIFIDTYKIMLERGDCVKEALIHTGVKRLRPILLTAGTTFLGLMPMVLMMNIDFLERGISFGAPSSQWWTQLATSIAGGLAFATILTLFFTPALLMLGHNVATRFKSRNS